MKVSLLPRLLLFVLPILANIFTYTVDTVPNSGVIVLFFGGVWIQKPLDGIYSGDLIRHLLFSVLVYILSNIFVYGILIIPFIACWSAVFSWYGIFVLPINHDWSKVVMVFASTALVILSFTIASYGNLYKTLLLTYEIRYTTLFFMILICLHYWLFGIVALLQYFQQKKVPTT